MELLTGTPLFPGDSDFQTLRMILETFYGSEDLSEPLKQAFLSNTCF